MSTMAGEDMSLSIDYGAASWEDMDGVADVFLNSFSDSMVHVFGRVPDTSLIRQIFEVCLLSEPDSFLVAREGNRVIGYIFAPYELKRLWQTATKRGFLWRWVKGWICGELGFGWHPLKVILLDKFYFLQSAFRDEIGTGARILSVAVAEETRGKGVGTRLVGQALERLERCGVDTVRLEVRPWNQAARRLYQGFGFKIVGTTADSQGEWQVMVKPFPKLENVNKDR